MPPIAIANENQVHVAGSGNEEGAAPGLWTTHSNEIREKSREEIEWKKKKYKRAERIQLRIY